MNPHFLSSVLMEESKVGMSQRKVIQDAVDKGESLPPPRKSMGDKQKSKEPQVNVYTDLYWKYEREGKK